ncbi:MAG: ferrous iron transport protein A [Pyrinomonadaceae bacterium]|nr:ferrous iron transport protein A [Pyrinomonadaceae bacterium]
MTNPKSNSLAHLPIGEEAKVLSIAGNSPVTRRLMEMGIIPGVSVKVVKTAPFGSPLQIKVRGYHLALRKSEAETIEVLSSKSKV